MQPINPSAANYWISTDRSLLDLRMIHSYLSEDSYWASGRTLSDVTKSIDHSICFGVFSPEGAQVGFARVVTDHATIAWLCDVFIAEAHRGQGLGKRLIETVISHPELRSVRRILLATRDAHGLYARYGGFAPLANPERWMERLPPAAVPEPG